MTESVLGRLVWKEYRMLRGFWIGMLLLCLLGQLVVLWECWRSPAPELARYLFLVAVVLTALYVLGCGCMAFAGERDAGTYLLQRVVPVTPARLLLGKLLFAAASAMLLGGLLWLLAVLLAWGRGWNVLGMHGELALLGSVKATELLAWGTFFSLRTARPLHAVVLAVLATALVAYPLSLLLTDIPDQSRGLLYFPTFLGDAWTAVPRLLVAALVLALDVRLVSRWFREPDTALDGDVIVSQQRSRCRRLMPWVVRSSQLQRLWWQLLVRTRWMLVSVAVVYGAVLSLLITFRDPLLGLGWEWFLPMLLAAGMFGIFAFAEDQRRGQFRFFAEQGISPSTIWWSRQLYWGLLLLVVLTVSSIVPCTGNRDQPDFWDFSGDFRRSLATAWVLAISIYAAGQICSQWIRSTIVAIPIACAASVVLAAWAGLMFGLKVNLLGSVATIPLIMLLGTWLTATDWVKDRHGGAARVRKVILVAVAALLASGNAIYYRWTEIPVMQPVVNLPAPTAEQLATDRETLSLYQQAWDKLQAAGRMPDASWSYESLQDFYTRPVNAERRSWLAQHQDLVELAMKLSQRPIASTAEGPDQAGYFLHHILMDSARVQQEVGNLDESLDQYLAVLRIDYQVQLWSAMRGDRRYQTEFVTEDTHLGILTWANRAGQSAQRIRRALKALNEIWSRLPTLEEIRVVNQFRSTMDFLEDPLHAGGAMWLHADRFERWFLHLLPWERERLRRLTLANTDVALKAIPVISRRLELGNAPPKPDPLERQIFRWNVERTLPYHYRGVMAGEITHTLVHRARVQRAVELVLALEGWRCDHGHLPEMLDRLVPEWFSHVPLDPIHTRPFEYYPQGIAEPILAGLDMAHGRYYGFDLPPGTPFIRPDNDRFTFMVAIPSPH